MRNLPTTRCWPTKSRKIRLNGACWSNQPSYVTFGRHFNAGSYFVLWYFLICPTSSWHLYNADSGIVRQPPLSAPGCWFTQFIMLWSPEGAVFWGVLCEEWGFSCQHRNLASIPRSIQEIWMPSLLPLLKITKTKRTFHSLGPNASSPLHLWAFGCLLLSTLFLQTMGEG